MYIYICKYCIIIFVQTAYNKLYQIHENYHLPRGQNSVLKSVDITERIMCEAYLNLMLESSKGKIYHPPVVPPPVLQGSAPSYVSGL